MPMTKRLIVNADDLGRSAGVNRGIFEAHTNGIVTSTTVMINMPGAPAAIEYALAHAPSLGVGLHLNLTTGAPLCKRDHVASLVDAGGDFHHISRWAAVYDRFSAGDFERELRAQVERFVALAGRPPDHLDAHHHASYLHPAALRALLDLAAEYNIPTRKPVAAGDPAQAAQYINDVLRDFPPDRVCSLVARLSTVLENEASAALPPWPDYMHRGFYGQTATLGDLLVILTTLPDNAVTELMCHPGYADGLDSSYAAPRERELAALTDPAAAEVIESEGIELISFADLSR
ncbi:MAG: ChbG/HpnK family deacetylase [Anaerolineae bacterium]|nr:ChbG/HpnK family deacetylase [Anaerolineae bacterium]